VTDTLGPFDIDIAAAKDSYNKIGTRANYYGPTGSESCGIAAKLKKSDFVWCNPPFGKKNGEQDFMAKMAEHNNGILLVPSKVCGNGFHAHVFPCAAAILFWRGAFMFQGEDGGDLLNFGGYQGVTLVAFGEKAATKLLKLSQHGHYMRNNHGN
jgi:hypothetical protein